MAEGRLERMSAKEMLEAILDMIAVLARVKLACATSGYRQDVVILGCTARPGA